MCLQEAMPIVKFSVQPQRTTRNHPSYDITLRTPRTKHSLGLRIRRRSCSTCEKTYDIYNQRQGSHATRHAKTELLLHRVESKPLIWPSSQWKPCGTVGVRPKPGSGHLDLVNPAAYHRRAKVERESTRTQSTCFTSMTVMTIVHMPN